MKKAAQKLLALVILGGIIFLARGLPIADWLELLSAWVQENPVEGAVVYLAITVVFTVLLTPGWILMMLAGLAFGPLLGLVYAVIGITGGAAAAFFVGRTLARRWVERQIEGNRHLMALDDALEEKAFTIVALTRVALVFPFNILNYAYGVTRVNPLVYTAGTAVGMLPIIGGYVYLGTLARDMRQILAEGADIGPGAWWAGGIALIAIITVVTVVRQALNRALERQTDTEESNTDDEKALEQAPE